MIQVIYGYGTALPGLTLAPLLDPQAQLDPQEYLGLLV
jgi:hypothetical protein